MLAVPYEPRISIGFLAVSHYLAAAVLVGVVAALLTGFHRVFGRRYLRYWALSWWAFAAYDAAGAASIALSGWGADHPARLALSALSLVASTLQLAWLLLGAWQVARGGETERRAEAGVLAGAAALGLAQALAFAWSPGFEVARLLIRVGGRQLMAFTTALVAAAWIVRAPSPRQTLGRRSLPVALVGWGVFQMVVLATMAAGHSGTPLVFASLTLLDLVAHGLLAVATVAWLLGEERAREEQRTAALLRSETMAALGTLVSGVAHEARNPLFGITSTVDALVARAREADWFRPHLGVLQREADRLNALMRDLLELGRPAAQTMVGDRLQEVLAEATRATATLAEERRVRVDCVIAEEIPLVRMDRRRMFQVFQNLIDNAVRHAPEGSAVRVSTALDRKDGEWIVSTIDDAGPGFAPGEEDQVFQPFFTHREGGTGLGLPIAQRIAEEHGGSLGASNRPGGGARLTVRLPVTHG